jgi:hypothetical protein
MALNRRGAVPHAFAPPGHSTPNPQPETLNRRRAVPKAFALPGHAHRLPLDPHPPRGADDDRRHCPVLGAGSMRVLGWRLRVLDDDRH